MSTPTPRTDEQINGKPCTRFCVLAGDSLRDALVPSDFARTLERELAIERARLDWLESDAGMEFQWETTTVITRAAIDAAMKEGA